MGYRRSSTTTFSPLSSRLSLLTYHINFIWSFWISWFSRTSLEIIEFSKSYYLDHITSMRRTIYFLCSLKRIFYFLCFARWTHMFLMLREVDPSISHDSGSGSLRSFARYAESFLFPRAPNSLLEVSSLLKVLTPS